MSKVISVLVTHNSASHLEAWLENIQKQTEPSTVVIVDNGSSDLTAVKLCDEQYLAQKGVSSQNVILDAHNNGFNRALNMGIRHIFLNHSDTEYIALLNHDATAENNWLEELLKVAMANAKSMVGSVIKDKIDREFISSLGHRLDLKSAKTYDVARKEKYQTDCIIKHQNEILTPCFAACLFSVQMVKDIGFPDNDQWMYYDDIDFFLRGRMKGYQTIIAPDAIAFHPFPGSTDNPALKESQESGRQKLKDNLDCCEHSRWKNIYKIDQKDVENLKLNIAKNSVKS